MDATASEVLDGPRHEVTTWILLAVGVLGASISAILIRYARDAEPIAVAFWRCVAAAVLLAAFSRGGINRMSPRQFRLPVIAGVFLAAHFATWITSLELTTVAASVLLVTSSPALVALLAWWLLGERLRLPALVGIGATILGAILIAGGDLSGSALGGNLLALAGAATAGGYILTGQVSRRELGIVEYSVVTYGAAAVVLLALSLGVDARLWGYGTGTWWALAGLVAGPQLLGHTVLNFVVKDVGATTVAVAVMAEPLIASILAYLLFSEAPPVLVYPGGAAILAGIYLVSTGRKPAPVVE